MAYRCGRWTGTPMIAVAFPHRRGSLTFRGWGCCLLVHPDTRSQRCPVVEPFGEGEVDEEGANRCVETRFAGADHLVGDAEIALPGGHVLIAEIDLQPLLARRRRHPRAANRERADRGDDVDALAVAVEVVENLV